MRIIAPIVLIFYLGVAFPHPASAQDFRKQQSQIDAYKRWLDSLGPNGTRFWIRLDSRNRPHRLYLGEAFFRADYQNKKRFVETFSIYLTSHPDKFMLIDLFDAATDRPVGEFGWGGFKLLSEFAHRSQNLQ
jgi:hypothetical protein